MARGRKAEIRALAGALSYVPTPPKWLPDHAKTEWKRVLPALVAGRKVAEHELSTVESYCLAIASVRSAEAVIASEGMTYVSPTGELKRRPETMILKENIEAARRLAAELGLTPASRNKNEGGAVGNEEADALGDL